MASREEQRQSPKSCIINKNKKKTTETSRKATTNSSSSSSSSRSKSRKRKTASLFLSPSSPLPSSCSPNTTKPPSPPPPPPPLPRNLSSVSDLKDLASSRFRDLKYNLIDRSHSAILQDLEASHSRLQKRFKIQTQSCQQLMDEAEKDFKKISGRMNETYEAIKDSYAEFLADAQATASRVCKTTIPELSKSCEKEIGSLQGRFGLTSA